jgi:hypothetical protein
MKKLVSLIAFVTLFASCVTENLEEGKITPSPITQIDPNVIPLDNALGEMYSLMDDLYGPQTRAASRTIASVENYKSAGGETRADGSTEEPIETLAYIVNFEEGGFAVLSATTAHESVVCITEAGSLTLEDLERARQEMQNAQKTRTDGGAPGWMSYEDIHDLGYEDVGGNPEPFVYEDYALDWDEGDTVTEDLGEYPVAVMRSGRDGLMHTPETFVPVTIADYYGKVDNSFLTNTEYDPWATVPNSKIGPLVTTKWHQDAPFNQKNESLRPAGCVPIAVAQIIAANEYPPTSVFGVTSTWDKLKDYSSFNKSNKTVEDLRIEEDIATIVRHIYLGVNAQPNLGGSGGTFAWPAAAKKYMKWYLGYIDAKKYESYKESKIEAMLNAGKPVFIGAVSGPLDIFCGIDAHAWVIDGSMTQQRIGRQYQGGRLVGTTTQSRFLIHCNFGWKGKCDGYYFPGVFNLKEGPVAVEEDLDEDIDDSTDSDYDWCFRVITY